MDYGIQMYSLRDITGDRMEYALETVAELGYKYIEFAGYGGLSAKQLRAKMDSLGLVCVSTHTGWGSVVNDFDRTVEFHRELGCTDITTPGENLKTKERLEDFARSLDTYLPKLHDAGFEMHYHNHAHEFKPNDDGIIIHEFLQKNTDIKFEIDTFWTYVAGLDPVSVITQLKDRIKFIHLKDGDSIGNGNSLGLGNAPVKEVRRKAAELGFIEIVESERPDADNLTDVRCCMDYLRALEALED